MPAGGPNRTQGEQGELRNNLIDRDIAIIGYGETRIERRSGKTAYELAAEVMAGIVAQTGVGPRDIDGLATVATHSEACNPFWAPFLADYLGLSPSWTQVTGNGGASPTGNVARAAAAIQAGYCEMVLCVNADAANTRQRSDQRGYRTDFLDPVGLQGPPGAFGFLMHRYMELYDLDFRALAKLAVEQRRGAMTNDNAYPAFRKPITEDDYLNARMVSEPLRLLDSVMRCDGGNGVLITTTERARAMAVNNMVHPVAYAELTNFDLANQTPEVTETGFSVVGPQVFEKAALLPGDIRMVHLYDDFHIATLLQLEQLAFCGRGEGSRFILETDISPTGALPINTGGGQISSGQPGLAGGGVQLIEAVRQLFGEAGPRQVPDAGNALVTGIGVVNYVRNWSVSAAMILEAGQ